MDKFRKAALQLMEENAPLMETIGGSLKKGETINVDEEADDDDEEDEEDGEEDENGSGKDETADEDEDDESDDESRKRQKKKQKKKKASADEDEEPSAAQESLGMIKELLDLFFFASMNDKMILMIGTLFTCIHGAGFPLLALLFGSMSNAFIQQSIQGFANESSDSNETVHKHHELPTFTSLFEKFSTKLHNTTGAEDVNFFENFEPLTKSEFVEYVTAFSWYYIWIGLIVGVATFIQVYCWEYAAENQVYRLRTKFLEQVLRQEIGWFDDHFAGDLSIKLADDIERIREGIGHKFSMVLEYLVTFGIGCGLGIMMNKDLSLILMSTTPLIIAKTLIMTKVIARRSVAQQQEFGEAGAISSEVLRGIRTVTAYGNELKEMRRYADELEDGVDMAIKKYHMVGVGTGAMYIMIYGSYALAFWYGCNMLLKHQISPGDIFTVFFSASMATFALGNILPFTSTIATAYGSTRILMPILKSTPTIDASSPKGKKPTKLEGSIKFTDVTFAYPCRAERQVLKDFNLELPAGKTYAIVGRSGSGKSTLLNLLLRFYDPQSGGISIDKYDLKKLNTKWLRYNIGVVAQSPVFQQGTIWENIRAGRKRIHFEEILKASKYACAHDFIKELPQGYNTVVGITGKQLSTSQRQCLAIARALVVNPPILILDEATSCLDKTTANTIHANVRRLRRGKTTLVIAHRLSTIRAAHVIYVLMNGEITEFGFHEKLMKKGGMYAKMVAEENIGDQINLTKLSDEQQQQAFDPDSTEVEIDILTTLDPSKRPDKKLVETEDVIKRAEQIANLPKTYPGIWATMSLAFEENWTFMILGTIGCILSGMIIPIFALYYGEIFQTFSKTGEELTSYSIYWVKLLILLAVIAGIGYWLRGVFVNTAGEYLALRLRVVTYLNIMRQPVSWFDFISNAPGRLYTRLIVDPPFIKAAVGSRLGTAMSAVVSVICAVAITFVFSSKLGILLLIAIPIFLFTVWGQYEILRDGNRKSAALMESALRITTRAIQDIWTVQCLSREKDVMEKFNEVLEPAFIEGHHQAKVYSSAFAFSECLIFLLLGAAFQYGAHLIDIEVLAPKGLFKIFFALAFCFVAKDLKEHLTKSDGKRLKGYKITPPVCLFYLAIGQATSFIPDFSKARLASALLDRLMNLESTIDPLDDEGEVPEVSGCIKFEEVMFSYPTRTSIMVLKGANFEIPAGSYVGIIGTYGCGKTSLFNLLERFYDANAGHIYLDGTDIRCMNVAYLRSQFGYVPQEANLFNMSIAENIGYGYQLTEDDEEDDDVFQMRLQRMVEEVAQAAGIHDFIESLPEKYNTLAGERGSRFTGGQRQRIAIARALIRNPKILLLDEPTSALDSTDEKLVSETLDKVRVGRTTIVLSSRPKPIRNTELVGVLQDGIITEWGTHEELAALQGFYYNFMKIDEGGGDNEAGPS